ncbi:hypothetical protein SCP_0107240 [Sparassis crispa]|uniref:Uncharacterized protein n=1 Tax=Sparassis crispa TaxID=139825 RepID=A0A401G6P3_9APHY|nr:hypothetical protein SCP_0107240 [Sparassis crispa]GBE77842.1 hypothetical protein SCP_0107240 [Sparassis crispa]
MGYILATWYEVGLGACGYTDKDSDPIVAISYIIYGSGGSCGQWMHITNTVNGIGQYGLTYDECEGQSDIVNILWLDILRV